MNAPQIKTLRPQRPGMIGTVALVDDDELRVTYYPGLSDTLVVTFNSAAHAISQTSPDEFVGLARGRAGRNHVISVTDRSRSWYSQPGQQQRIVRALRTHIKTLDPARIMTLGSSMGGHGAMLFAERIGAHKAIGFVPQFTMHSRIAEPRWSELRPAMMDDHLKPLRPFLTGRTRAICMFGAADRQDRRHFRWMAQNCVAEMHLLKGFSHELPRELKAKGLLDDIVHALLTDDDAQVLRILSPMSVPVPDFPQSRGGETA